MKIVMPVCNRRKIAFTPPKKSGYLKWQNRVTYASKQPNSRVAVVLFNSQALIDPLQASNLTLFSILMNKERWFGKEWETWRRENWKSTDQKLAPIITFFYLIIVSIAIRNFQNPSIFVLNNYSLDLNTNLIKF